MRFSYWICFKSIRAFLARLFVLLFSGTVTIPSTAKSAKTVYNYSLVLGKLNNILLSLYLSQMLELH